jgi:hypothetical protein
VTYVGPHALYGCTGLTSIHCQGMTPPRKGFSSPIAPDICQNVTLYVPKGALSAYQSANDWKDFKTIVEE